MLIAPLLSMVTALALTIPSLSSPGDVVTGPVDKTAFQALIDNANEGDEIRCLGGVYDFSAPGAVLITKGLRIVADDPMNPPIFMGALSSNGAYATGTELGFPFPSNFTGNTAFALPPGAIVDGLEIKGLHFIGFERAFFSAVEFDFSPTSCALIASPGLVTDLVLDGNDISNCGFGIQLLGGPVEGFEIKNNTIDCSGGILPINVQGDFVNCGVVPWLNLTRLKDGEIKDNVLFGAAGPPTMQVAGIDNVEVTGNTLYSHPASNGLQFRDLKAATLGPFAGATPAFGDDGPIAAGEIKNNTIHNARIAIQCFVVTNLCEVEIKGNTIVNTSPNGIDVLFNSGAFLSPTFNAAPGLGANGIVLKENTFSTTAAFNVLLLADTYNNEVTVPTGTNVLDLAPPGSNEVKFK